MHGWRAARSIGRMPGELGSWNGSEEGTLVRRKEEGVEKLWPLPGGGGRGCNLHVSPFPLIIFVVFLFFYIYFFKNTA
jgi:hypothetical protein